MKTRRSFFKTSTAVIGGSVLAKPMLSQLTLPSEHYDPDAQLWIQRGIDQALALGAAYADIRLTHSWDRKYTRFGVRDFESITVGARALVDGYWGWASSPVFSATEVVRLGQEAVHQAKAANVLGKPRLVELAPTSVIRGEHWTMPILIDPFSVHPAEVLDLLKSLDLYTSRCGGLAESLEAVFFRQDKSFGSSDGAYWTQRIYRTGGDFVIMVGGSNNETVSKRLEAITPTGVGLELWDESVMRDSIDQAIGELKLDLTLPLKPIDVGRYDTIMTAASVAPLLSGTVGAATELDRALGYEANASGTSYLNDPFSMIGTYVVGAPLLTIVANRTDPGGVATVAWDDEGVTPQAFPLVKEGVLMDYQTTREGACWLRDVYAKRGVAIQSHGCAYAPAAIDAPLSHTANLVMTPSHEQQSFDTLVKTMKKGLACKDLKVSLDFQQLSGFATTSRCYEVVDGKLVARLANVGILFKQPELWKSLVALGGSEGAQRFGYSATKSEPPQRSYHSITSVPARFNKLTVIDIMRKA